MQGCAIDGRELQACIQRQAIVVDHRATAGGFRSLHHHRKGILLEDPAFLHGIGSAPALATLDGVLGTVPPDSVLGFSLATLRRDLADLDERLAEQVTGDAG